MPITIKKTIFQKDEWFIVLGVNNETKEEVKITGELKDLYPHSKIIANVSENSHPKYGLSYRVKEYKFIEDTNSVYNLLAAIKTLVIQKPATADNMVIDTLKQQINDIATSLKTQIVNLQNEVATIKKSVIALAKAVKDQMNSKPAPQQNPKPAVTQQKPISVKPQNVNRTPSSAPRPVPISENELNDLAPKPISLRQSLLAKSSG